MKKLHSAAFPLAGIEALALDLIAEAADLRERRCMGAESVREIGATDPRAPGSPVPTPTQSPRQP
jgi:hypothetical protein